MSKPFSKITMNKLHSDEQDQVESLTHNKSLGLVIKQDKKIISSKQAHEELNLHPVNSHRESHENLSNSRREARRENGFSHNH